MQAEARQSETAAQKIQIRARFDGAVLFEAECESVQDALVLAVRNNAKLSGVDLRGVDLRRLNLPWARLVGAALSGANLSGAILREADLRGAILRGAILREADLRCADLRGADLSGADLSGANLTDTILAGNNLPKADLTGAIGITEDVRSRLAAHACGAPRPPNLSPAQQDIARFSPAMKDAYHCALKEASPLASVTSLTAYRNLRDRLAEYHGALARLAVAQDQADLNTERADCRGTEMVLFMEDALNNFPRHTLAILGEELDREDERHMGVAAE